MRKLLLVSVSVMLLASSVLAFQPAIEGGYRDGMAIGLIGKSPVARNVALQIGVEATSGKQPLVGFLGGKFYLSNMGRMPLSFGLAGVAYSGDAGSEFGVGLSAILDRAFGVRPMFVEFGVDVVGEARAQLQVGYRLY
jgi:hypothetical protein